MTIGGECALREMESETGEVYDPVDNNGFCTIADKQRANVERSRSLALITYPLSRVEGKGAIASIEERLGLAKRAACDREYADKKVVESCETRTGRREALFRELTTAILQNCECSC